MTMPRGAKNPIPAALPLPARIGCVVCILWAQLCTWGRAQEGRAPGAEKSRTAYVTLVTGDGQRAVGYGVGALALGESLVATDPGRDRIALVTHKTSPIVKRMLEGSGLWRLVEVDALPCGAESTEITAEGGIAAQRKPDARCSKFRLFDPAVQELAALERFVFIDADAYVKPESEGMGRLFNYATVPRLSSRAVPFLAVRDCPVWPDLDGYAVDSCNIPDGTIVRGGFMRPPEFNTGMIVADPCPQLYRHNILDLATHWNQTWRHDQDALNALMKDQYADIATLGTEYNTLYCCLSSAVLMEQRATTARLVHFSVQYNLKPWIVYKYELMESDEGNEMGRWYDPAHPYHQTYEEWKRLLLTSLVRVPSNVQIHI